MPPPTTNPVNVNIQRWENNLTLIHEFISEEEEATMIAAFHSAQPKPEPTVSTGSRKRLSQHFGYHFDYTTFGASETTFTPLPKYIEDLLPRLPIQDHIPDQFTMQYYPPGAGIPPHVDTHSLFGEALYALSLGSSVPIEFRKCNASDARRMRLPKRSLMSGSETSETVTTTNPEPTRTRPDMQGVNETLELFLPPRSLLVMMGPSRYGYTHGIRGRKTDQVDGQTVARVGRYSITMRTVKRGAEVGCDCGFPGVCDARIAEEVAQAQGSRGKP
ncbi:Uncharacterized protein TPAR_07870 [Tolypocladium paradoxum]|uniref:Fe2OG dioxygenase domain-containing protein n=1 Tax=Tolypocladium paradoxum TaxID=94208 RepID=A0A2S4KP06_9HYPO|nr:Uncharacterized protein TPAR_07870 [Tolypocladium paradoxum]